MGNIYKGIGAGLVATVVLSLLMVLKTATGLMPALDPPRMIAGMIGMPHAPIFGWLGHFAIGIAVYGLAIAWLDQRLPGRSHILHGITLGVIGWLIMMIVVMPMAGAGLFGLSMGVAAPVMTLLLHLVFGAVLGSVYGWEIEHGGPASSAAA